MMFRTVPWNRCSFPSNACVWNLCLLMHSSRHISLRVDLHASKEAVVPTASGVLVWFVRVSHSLRSRMRKPAAGVAGKPKPAVRYTQLQLSPLPPVANACTAALLSVIMVELQAPDESTVVAGDYRALQQASRYGVPGTRYRRKSPWIRRRRRAGTTFEPPSPAGSSCAGIVVAFRWTLTRPAAARCRLREQGSSRVAFKAAGSRSSRDGRSRSSAEKLR